MNRCIKVGNLKAFKEAIAVVKEILQRGELPGFLEKLATLKDQTLERNLLHVAAAYACKEDDARFFTSLLNLGFPLYGEDRQGDFAGFLIADIRGDGVFLEAFDALTQVGFDFAKKTKPPRSQTFISRLYQSNYVSVQKMKAMLRTQP